MCRIQKIRSRVTPRWSGSIFAEHPNGCKRTSASQVPFIVDCIMLVDMQERRIGVLSGGQKARLMMLALRLANPNFYLLDEPTNHLDIDGQEALEAELLEHQASCLLASHDRSFIRAVGNRFWLIEKRRLTEIDSPEEFFREVAEAGG
ncbi:ATP-binding cassette domain-containing protein [Mesorhizobium sp. M0814]|uniref:ATP-binding cassette domain-containing protein n=1 Tax=unclassified Mesorhizobium TaxID=325217 RepID=UPI00333B4D18